MSQSGILVSAPLIPDKGWNNMSYPHGWLAPMITNVNVDDVTKHAVTLSSITSSILLGLARGDYDKEVILTENVLFDLSLVFPPLAEVEKALQFFLWINKVTAPRGAVVSDGRGGWVPESNSRYDSKTGEFL